MSVAGGSCSVVRVAWYTMLVALQLPSRGQASLTLQLQGRSGFFLLIILELCAEMSFLKFGVVLYDIFTVFLLITLWRGWFFGKC